MAHTIGRSIVVDRIIEPGTTEFSVTNLGIRFVILRFTNAALMEGAQLRVQLNYGEDVFTHVSGNEHWSRPIDPRVGPIRITLTGSESVTLREYLVGERTPGTDFSRPNVSHCDPFLHTSPHEDAEYETTFRCGDTFDWINLRAAPADPAIRRAADAVCLILIGHYHDALVVPSSCTGTLIGPDLILTAHHCFLESDGIDWKSASVTFDNETADLAGNRPTPYSPVFHKVTGVVGRSRATRTTGEWIILQIQTPPGGLGITPLELRETPTVDGEPIHAIHHPHGSPKKYQGGSPTRTRVPGFDFAGGSSGSSLFDSEARVIGGPLSNGGGCSAEYTAATTVVRDMETPRAPTNPFDVVLVLDRSGSMLQTAPPEDRTKMQEAQSAAAMFIRMVREGAGDRLGIVSYSNAASIDEAIGTAGVDAGVKDRLAGSGTAPGGILAGLTPGGTTSIGDGLIKAVQVLSDAPASENQRAILLLTDGLHNTPPAVRPIELANTSLSIAGFGYDHELDGPILRALAGSNGGSYTRGADGLSLHKIFALRFGNIFESGMLRDPEFILGEDQDVANSETFFVCNEETVTLVVMWDDSRNDLDAVVELPDGSTRDFNSADVISARGETWWFVRVPVPPGNNGNWRYKIRRAPIHGEFPPDALSLRVTSVVIPKGGPKLTPRPQTSHVYTGDDLVLSAGLFNPDGTAPRGRMTATLQLPDGSMGALAQGARWQGPLTSGDPLDGFRNTLRNEVGASRPPVPLRSMDIELLDDGNQLDGSFVRDGFFTNRLKEVTRFEGTYTIHARALYACHDGDGSREAIWSFYVEPGIDGDQTEVEVIPSGAGQGVLRVTPRDRYGNPLGPGRADSLNIGGWSGTTVTGSARDRRDGSYDVPATWEPGGSPGLSISQPDRDPVIVPSGTDTVPEPENGCPVWLCWLLGLIAIGLLIVVVFLLI